MPTPGVNAIVEITTQLLSADVPRDFCTNHLCFNTTAPSVTTAQWQALTDAIKGVHFATSAAWIHYGNCAGKVVAYDRADLTPRPEKAATIYTPGTWNTVVHDRVCSLCLSFYAGRNLKRLRGRIYMPPNVYVDPGTERAGSSNMNAVLQYGTQLDSVVRALTPAWGQTVHSKVDNMDWGIDHWWVNDVWDHIRRRSPKESTRVHSP